MVQDIDRPDVNGTPPKMQAICDQVKLALDDIVPYLNTTTDDNIRSSVFIHGTFEPKTDWPNNIFHNARYFIICISPMNGKRYYDPNDPKVTVEIGNKHHKLTKLRKYTGPIDKVIQKIKDWIKDNKPSDTDQN